MVLLPAPALGTESGSRGVAGMFAEQCGECCQLGQRGAELTLLPLTDCSLANKPVEEVLGGKAPSCVGSAALTCKQQMAFYSSGDSGLSRHRRGDMIKINTTQAEVAFQSDTKSKLELGFAFWSEGPKRLHEWLMK